MDSIRYVDALIGVVGVLMGWILKILWESSKEVKLELAKLKDDLPVTYARKDDVRDGFQSLNRTLERILDKLDSKQDKP
jgi:CRISPR/Cas system CSM-associated protein Csm2 small subunit